MAGGGINVREGREGLGEGMREGRRRGNREGREKGEVGGISPWLLEDRHPWD